MRNWLENNVFNTTKHQSHSFPSDGKWKKYIYTFIYIYMHTRGAKHMRLRIAHERNGKALSLS